MENTKIHRVLMLFLLGIMAYLPMKAQYMPVFLIRAMAQTTKYSKFAC